MGTTESTILDIDLTTSGLEGVEVTLQVVGSGDTDDLDASFYKSRDGTNDDDITFYEFSFPTPDTESDQKTFTFLNTAHILVGTKSSGSTNTFTVTYSWKGWNWTDA